MSQAATAPTISIEARRASFLSSLAGFSRQQPVGALSLIVILVMLVASVFAEWIAPYDPLDIDYFAILQAPSWDHLAGTDPFGRDVFTRLIYGARTALVIGLSASFVGCTLGALLGAASAYFGGRTDAVIQRFVDVLLSFPLVVLALVVVAVLGRNLVFGIDIGLVFAIAIPIIPQVSRVIRAAALSIRNMSYIDAARTAGYSNMRIIMRHMAPNLIAPYLIMLTAYIAQAILLEASLSFLGLGVAEPTPAWGLMLSGNATDYFITAPWLIIFPGIAISLAVIAFNLFGDALRDWLDPKFRN
ncbi:MAG TPA: ABC transporter permease [Rhizobiaceae bacterium]|nr:ABC transporter permease [Rhizobiaceae bacterium]